MKEFKVTIGWSKERPFINVVFKGERFRYSNGKSIGLNIKAKDDPELLCNAFRIKLLEGWVPVKRSYDSVSEVKQKDFSILNHMREVLSTMTEEKYSYHHIRDCKWAYRNFQRFLKSQNIQHLTAQEWETSYLLGFVNSNQNWSNRTRRNLTTSFRFLTRGLNLKIKISFKQTRSKLHRRINNLAELLDDIKSFDFELYLVCLITYGCLLRPHQEIRLLTWSEIDLNRGLISLDGLRNKTGRNRVVPIPSFVMEELNVIKSNDALYVFGNTLPRNRDYFSTKWTRYKHRSQLDLTNITLYSFRHTGAINVFEKTGSIYKVKEVMGHSNIQVSMIYLRGIDTTNLSPEDMPQIHC
ncbi:MAG: Tyrosine recombinase XerD-like protein [Flavobacteriaceae bacterium]|nr:MAG: Tyrosine recombinase XerD-like protein [Flavobacteriaceae bacterium]